LDKLYLDRAGLYPCDKGFLQVDENFRTTHAHIFAAGDVLQQEHLTPVAIAQGHYIANFLFDPPSTQKKDFDFIATAIFSSPEIATLGLTEQELHRRQKPYKVYKTNFRPLKETIANTSYKSCLYKIVVCAETDRILGLHLCGPYVSEILQGFAAAIRQGLTKSELDQTLAIHPTMAEEIVLMPNLSEKTNPERLAS
jgi:glutathione reductase (NADPH)